MYRLISQADPTYIVEVTVPKGGSTTVYDLPCGSYTVEQVNSWSWRYDADGAQVGTALANTNNLKAGGTWKFEAVGTASPDEVASYERVDVTGF